MNLKVGTQTYRFSVSILYGTHFHCVLEEKGYPSLSGLATTFDEALKKLRQKIRDLKKP